MTHLTINPSVILDPSSELIKTQTFTNTTSRSGREVKFPGKYKDFEI